MSSPYSLPEWMGRAACIGMATEVFFPRKEMGETHMEAKRVCKGCPVREDCLDYAIKNRIKAGIWGGLGEKARRAHARRLHVQELMDR